MYTMATSFSFVAKVKDDVDAEMLKMMKDMDQYQATLEKRLQEVTTLPLLSAPFALCQFPFFRSIALSSPSFYRIRIIQWIRLRVSEHNHEFCCHCGLPKIKVRNMCVWHYRFISVPWITILDICSNVL